MMMKCQDTTQSATENKPRVHRRYSTFFIADILGDEREKGKQQEIPNENSKSPARTHSTNEGSERHLDEEENESYVDAASGNISHEDPATRRSQGLPSNDQEWLSHLKSRSPFLAVQRETLEKTFQRTKYISSGKRKELAAHLKLSERQIKTWFQNRRTKWRKIRGSGGLRRQDTMWEMTNRGVRQILSNIDGGMNGLHKEWVFSLYSLLSKR